MNMSFFIIISLLFNSIISINEVMSNVRGAESGILGPGDRNECVELYNCSNDTVFTNNLNIGNEDGMDRILPFIDSLNLFNGITDVNYILPGQFAVILDPEYIIEAAQYYMPYCFDTNAVILTISTTTFTDNGLSMGDNLFLTDSLGNILSTFGTPELDDAFPYDAGDGISLERINPQSIDSKSNWAACADIQGHTLGYKNSVFNDRAIINCVYLKKDTLFIEFSYIPPAGDSICIETQNSSDMIYIYSDTSFMINEPIVNVIIEEKAFSALKSSADVFNNIILNEFYVKGSECEWIEIHNRFNCDFYGCLCIADDDSIIINECHICRDSFIIICDDIYYLQYDFPYIKSDEFLYKSNISLPDRVDTFYLYCNNECTDSIIRGYEDYGDYSIERINGVFSYDAYAWDICISEYRGTPMKVNSLSLSENDDYRCILSHQIWYSAIPFVTLSIESICEINSVNIYIYSETGSEAYSMRDMKISESEDIILKWQYFGLNKGMYIMLVEIINNMGKNIQKIPFYIR